MSRSYKKSPWVTDHTRRTTKESKRLANRIVRRRLKRGEDMPSRLPHRKMTETWDICDYRWRMSEEQAIEWYNHYSEDEASDYFKKHYPTLEDWLEYYKKCYVRK